MSARRGEAYPVVRQPQSIDSRASEEDAGEPPLVLTGHGRIEAEDIEDRERGLAGGAIGEGAVETHGFEEFVERGFVLLASGEQYAEAVPGAGIARVGARFACEVLGGVLAGKGIEEDAVLERLRAAVAGGAFEQFPGFRGVPASEEDAGKADDRVRVGWRGAQRLAETGLGGRRVVRGERLGLARGPLRRRGDELLEERPNLRIGDGAGEFGHDLTVAERLHGGDALDAVLGRRSRVLIRVELGEEDVIAERGGDALDGGAEHTAGAAPRRPEIDNDDAGVGRGEDVAGKGGVGHIEDGRGGGHA